MRRLDWNIRIFQAIIRSFTIPTACFVAWWWTKEMISWLFIFWDVFYGLWFWQIDILNALTRGVRQSQRLAKHMHTNIQTMCAWLIFSTLDTLTNQTRNKTPSPDTVAETPVCELSMPLVDWIFWGRTATDQHTGILHVAVSFETDKKFVGKFCFGRTMHSIPLTFSMMLNFYFIYI